MSPHQFPETRSARRRTALWNVVFAYTNIAVVLTRYILLVPLYLAFVSVEEYGAWLATGVVLSQIVITDFGLVGSVVQRASAVFGSGDDGRLASTLGAGLVASIAMGCVQMLGAWVLAPWVTVMLDLSPGVAPVIAECFLLVGIANGISTVGAAATGIVKSVQRPVLAGVIVLGSELVSIGATVALLFAEWGLYALAGGLLVRAGVYGLVGTTAFSRVCSRGLGIRPRASMSEIRALLGASANLFVSTLFMKIQTRGDTFFVGTLVGAEAAAVYGLTIRAQDTLVLAFGQLRGALMPSLANLHGAGASARFREVSARIFAILVMFGSAGYGTIVARNGDFLRLWVGEELYGGLGVTAVFACAGFVAATGAVFYDTMIAQGRFGFTRRVYTVCGLAHVLLVVTFLQIGLIGAPLAAVASMLLWAVLFGRHYGRLLGLQRIDWLHYARTAAAGGAAAILAASAGHLLPAPGWMGFVAACVATAMLGFAAFLALDRNARNTVVEELGTLNPLRRKSG